MPFPRPNELHKLRLAVGVGLLVLSFVPWIIAAIMPFVGLSPGTVAASIGGLIVIAEVIGAVAVVVLGHEAYGAIRAKLRGRSLGRSDEPPRPLNTDLQRVVVIGTSCSGKTTLARQLSDLLAVPHIELDALHWKRHWEARPRVEFLRIVEKAVARDRWVTDGNYGTARDIVWSRATAVLWLNYSFVRVFYRALSRTLQRAATREELYSGNTESFTKAFLSRDSILLWVLTSFRRRRREYSALLKSDHFASITFWEFRRPRDAAFFLSTLKAAAQQADKADPRPPRSG